MSRSKEDPRVANRERHVSRHAPWNAKPMKKSGGGKGNWGVEGDEVLDSRIPVNQIFEDEEFRAEEAVKQQEVNKIKVISREEIESTSSSEE